MNKKCLNCGKVFERKKWESNKYWPLKKYCSIACSGTTFQKGHSPSANNIRITKSKTREKNPSWRGGKHLSNGYVVVLVGRKKYQSEHRYVMEGYLGRKLLKTEHIHHINGDRTDNRIENLQLIDPHAHASAHSNNRWHGIPVGLINARHVN